MRDLNHKKVGKNQGMIWIVIILLAILSVNLSCGYEASGGNITVWGGLGVISFDGNNSHILGGIGPASKYNYATIEGYFGLFVNEQSNLSDNTAPVITLLSPAKDAGTFNTTANFVFNVIDDSTLSCVINIDNSSNVVSSNNGMNTYSKVLGISLHYWNITCTDEFNNVAYSETRRLTVLHASTFDNNSTDLSSVNISAIPNLSLSKSGVGKIVFSGFTDLSGEANLSSVVRIEGLSVFVDTVSMPILDKLATIYVYNVPYIYTVLWKDGSVCSSCSFISNSGGELIFDVIGFSNYTITSTSSLHIYDDTDVNTKYYNQPVIFYANYSNITSGEPITANCDINIYEGSWSGPYVMSYDGVTGLYYYNTTFNNSEGTQFGVNCTSLSSGFDNLGSTDNFRISGPGGAFADITINQTDSSRMNLSYPAVQISASAGNITDISRFETSVVTTSWQGYYGNITGTVVLKSSNGSSFYEWSTVSWLGEIYATRVPNPLWTSIRCSNSTEMDTEDTYLGMNPLTSGDSLSKTFFNTVPINTFYVGDTLIDDSQNCYATNLFDSTGSSGTTFLEVLLHDGSNMIYTVLIEPAALGFDNREHDFELIVGENGKNDNTIATTYYFFLELS